MTFSPYPRPVRDIHQIELSTRCNLKCHYCIDPDQQVQTVFGAVRAEDLEVGNEVYGADGTIRRVLSCVSHQEEIVGIQVKNLPPIKVSASHGVLTRRGFIEAACLSLDDYVALPQPVLPSPPTHINLLPFMKFYKYMRTPCKDLVKMDAEVAWLLGLYAAEGCTGVSGERESINCIQITLSEKETILADKAERILKEKFGVLSKRRHQASVLRVYVMNVRLAAFFFNVLGGVGIEKRIPFELLGRKWLGAYLKGLFEGDGFRGRNGASLQWELSTSYPRLRDDVIQALLSLGILPAVFTRAAHESTIEGRVIFCRDEYSIRVVGPRADMLERHFSGLPFNKAWVPKRLADHSGVIYDGKYWLKVKAVTKLSGKAQVIGVEVDGDHTIVVGHMATHNCPHYPELPRAKEDMSEEVFSAALDLVRFYVQQGTQTELSLTGIGEAMLHTRFVEYATRAREVVGPDRRFTITTNGLLLDDAMAVALAPLRPSVFISLHRPEKAGLAIEIAKKHGILAGVNASFATSAFDWAGAQKNWFVSAPKIPCDYLKSGWAVILVDGGVATCCLDADGSSVVGSVRDRPETLMLKPWKSEKGAGCEACHMSVP